jgi:catechol 2,3-dioxygenase
VCITQVAYAELAVDDLDGSVGFHTDVVGMVELGRENNHVNLGCGVDGRIDLVLQGGGTGVRLIGLEVESEDDLDRYADKLGRRAIDHERLSDPRTGVAHAVRFAAPNGLAIELVLTEPGPAYLNPGQATPGRAGIGPVDFDHITLKVPDPEATVEFLTSVLGFSVSDEMRPQPDLLAAAWTRAGQQHHDIAMFKGPAEQTLHHYALRLESFEHLKSAADRLAAAGIRVETGPGRHSVGGNVYLFFWAPGGNRLEFSAEMPRVGKGDTKVWTDLQAAFSAWGGTPPATFAEGS